MNRPIVRSAGEEWVEISTAEKLVPDPLVSVFMLVYNHAPFLRDSVASVIAQQTDFPFELLIGEDCSTDGSGAVARELQKQFPEVIRVITSDANVGMARNKRRLVAASRGEFIAFCEGDDYWSDPQKLQRQVEFLTIHPEYGAVHTDFGNTLSRFGSWVLRPKMNSGGSRAVPSGDIFQTLLQGNFIQTCTFCAKAELVKAALASALPIDSYPVGDWPQGLYIAAHSKIGYIDLPTAVYRRTPGSIMNSSAQRRLDIARAYEPMLEDFFRHFNVDPAVQKAALSSLHRTLLSLALLAGDRLAFKISWDWLGEHDPAETKPFRRQLMPLLMRFELARRSLVVLLRTRDALFEAWLYRKPANQVGRSKLKDNDPSPDR
jgi:glycosyltransferase involved in cell wall biosynthesis